MTLSELNHLPAAEVKALMLKCCGSTNWANKMLTVFPVEDMIDLFEDAEDKWWECNEADWKEAFNHHPKIGDTASLKEKFASTAQWASGEQSGVEEASEKVLHDLAHGNHSYEQKFGFIFIVCATGKSAKEMFDLLNARLPNSHGEELQIAAEEQAKITQIRLGKLLGEEV